MDVVKALDNIADEAIKVSDVPIKGFGGIAAAPAALTMIALIASGQWITAGVTAAGVVGFSRILRNKGVLKLLTSSKMRASEYNKALAAGAKLPSLARAREAGEITYALNRIGSILASETALVTGAGVGLMGEMEDESTKIAQRTVRDIQQGRQQPTTQTPRTRSDRPTIISREEWYGARPAPIGPDALRQVEQNKLLGIAPGQ